MPKDITINNYIKYWESGTPTGHQIKIAYGTLYKSKTLTINLNWPDRTRDKDGRVTTHWGKKDFLDQAEREKKELAESYKESVRQAKERKDK